MTFPVGEGVGGLWMDRAATHKIREIHRVDAQYDVPMGHETTGYPPTFTDCFGPGRVARMAADTTSEASMQNNWKSIGELAKRLVEKQVRGK